MVLEEYPKDIINKIENNHISLDDAIDLGYIGDEYTNLPNVLYHYCSYETFELIITNRTLRFTSLNGSNDLLEHLNRYVIKMLKDKSLLGNFSKKLRVRLINAIQDSTNMANEIEHLMSCFSDCYDDLGQWRTTYGNYGKGICIGFNTDFFTQNQFNVKRDHNLGWIKINYDLMKQKKYIGQILEKYKYNEDEEIDEMSIYDLAREIIACAKTMKHKAFNIENEWRMVALRIDNVVMGGYFGNIEYYDNGRAYADYNIELRTEDTDIQPFHSILIGAECKKEKKEIENLLKVNGFHCKNIRKSAIPYIYDSKKLCSHEDKQCPFGN